MIEKLHLYTYKINSYESDKIILSAMFADGFFNGC